jgi:menaquinone-dependent protoporphyrinogen oxidase
MVARSFVMSRILVLYASHHGQTRAIAEVIATRLRDRGHVAELVDVGVGVSPMPAPEDYDAVVLGSRLELGRHARPLVRYVRRHREHLAVMPTAFFSVSMSAAQAGAGADPNGYIARFFADAGWRAGRAIAIPGALRYRAYGWATRLVMKAIARRGGHATDTSRDHEYTDWAQVLRFADQIGDDLRDLPRPPPSEATDRPDAHPAP